MSFSTLNLFKDRIYRQPKHIPLHVYVPLESHTAYLMTERINNNNNKTTREKGPNLPIIKSVIGWGQSVIIPPLHRSFVKEMNRMIEL